MKQFKNATRLLRCAVGLGVVTVLLQPASFGARGGGGGGRGGGGGGRGGGGRGGGGRSNGQGNNQNSGQNNQNAQQQQGQTPQQQAASNAQWVTMMMGDLDGVVSLTPEQKQTIMPIFQDEAEQRTTLRNNQNLTTGDRATRFQQIQQGAEDKISKVLTADQLQRIDEAQGDKMLDNLTKQLGLTAYQQAKIRPLLLDEAKQVGAIKRDTTLTPEVRTDKQAAADDTAWEQIEPILTPAQQKMLDQQRLDGMLANLTKALTLTPDQVTKVKAALDATLPQMRLAREDATLTSAVKEQKLQGVRDLMWEKVGAALTLDQQKQLETLRYNTPKHAGGQLNTAKP